MPLGRGEKGRLILLPKGALWGLDVDAGGLGAPGPSQLNAPGASATTPAGKITPAEERCQRFLPKSTVGIRTVTRCQGGNAKTFWRFVTLHLCWVMAEVGETDLGRVELYADRSRTEPRTSLLDGRLTHVTDADRNSETDRGRRFSWPLLPRGPCSSIHCPEDSSCGHRSFQHHSAQAPKVDAIQAALSLHRRKNRDHPKGRWYHKQLQRGFPDLLRSDGG